MFLSNVRLRFVPALFAGIFCFVVAPVVAQQVATPTFTPGGNYYNLEQSVRIDCATAGATINYTTNGVDPTSSDRVIASGGTLLVDHAITLMHQTLSITKIKAPKAIGLIRERTIRG